MIRTVRKEDATQIRDIYNYYILNSVITFEEVPVTTAEMEQRITNIASGFPWVVYEENKEILGYAYGTKWKIRSAYKHATEVTVYLKQGAFKKGLGTRLYTELIDRLKKKEFHALIGGIALPNDASIALHKKLGFQKIGHFKEVGFKFNRWVDVTYWELLL